MIIAHRGGKPENTIKAFVSAIKNNVNGIEFDVWKTMDGQFVVVHDAELNNEYISDLTCEEVLQFDPTIPTLKEALDSILFASIKHSHSHTHFIKTIINIEMKPFDIAIDLAKWLREYLIAIEKKGFARFLTIENFVVTSFLHTEIDLFHNTFPEISVGLLFRSYPLHIDHILRRQNYISLIVLNKNAIHYKHIRDLREKNKDIEIWVYCESKSIDKQKEECLAVFTIGVDAYITDYAGELQELVN